VILTNSSKNVQKKFNVRFVDELLAHTLNRNLSLNPRVIAKEIKRKITITIKNRAFRAPFFFDGLPHRAASARQF
jgi:hypothetical protein